MNKIMHSTEPEQDYYIIYSSLYPNPFQPVHGIFVNELVRSLSAHHPVSVIAPINGLRNVNRIRLFKKKHFNPIDSRVHVSYPIFWTFPKIFKQFDALLMAYWTQQVLDQAIKLKRPALLHAHYAYPEAAAAGILCRKYDIPLVVTVHGSDINVMARDPKRQRQIIKTLSHAKAVVAVSQDLVKKIKSINSSLKNVYHIPNGVDLKKFFPANENSIIKHKLPFKHSLLAVGRLEKVKAYDRLINALQQLSPEVGLILVGDGKERNNLEKMARNLGVRNRIHFAGTVSHSKLSRYYQCADFTVISSHSEGWPTIIYESLACGTPVVTNAVGGIPEILNNPELGILAPDNAPETLAATITQAFKCNWNTLKAVEAAQTHSWDTIANRYLKIFKSVSNEKN